MRQVRGAPSGSCRSSVRKPSDSVRTRADSWIPARHDADLTAKHRLLTVRQSTWKQPSRSARGATEEGDGNECGPTRYSATSGVKHETAAGTTLVGAHRRDGCHPGVRRRDARRRADEG